MVAAILTIHAELFNGLWLGYKAYMSQQYARQSLAIYANGLNNKVNAILGQFSVINTICSGFRFPFLAKNNGNKNAF